MRNQKKNDNLLLEDKSLNKYKSGALSFSDTSLLPSSPGESSLKCQSTSVITFIDLPSCHGGLSSATTHTINVGERELLRSKRPCDDAVMASTSKKHRELKTRNSERPDLNINKCYVDSIDEPQNVFSNNRELLSSTARLPATLLEENASPPKFKQIFEEDISRPHEQLEKKNQRSRQRRKGALDKERANAHMLGALEMLSSMIFKLLIRQHEYVQIIESCDPDKTDSEKFNKLQKFLEFYFSDSNLLHDLRLQSIVGLEKDNFESSEISRELTYASESFKSLLISINGALTDEDLEKIACDITRTKDKSLGAFIENSCSTGGIDESGYLWVELEELMSIPAIKVRPELYKYRQALEVSVDDLLSAAILSPRLFVLKPSIKDLDNVCSFMLGPDWDRSEIGSGGAGNLSYQFGGYQGCPILGEGLSRLQSCITGFKHTTAISRARICREWTHALSLKSLESTLMARTVFINNLPLKCTPEHLKCVLLEGIGSGVEHVRIPRYMDSRENKGFAFVELTSPADVPLIINKFNNQWPQCWAGCGVRFAAAADQNQVSSTTLDGSSWNIPGTTSSTASAEVPRLMTMELKNETPRGQPSIIEDSANVPKSLPDENMQDISVVEKNQEQRLKRFAVEVSKLSRRNSRPLTVLSYDQWVIRKANTKSLDQYSKISTVDEGPATWIKLTNLPVPVTSLTIYQFIKSSVETPLRVNIDHSRSVAYVLLSSASEAEKLQMSVLISKPHLGGADLVAVVVCTEDEVNEVIRRYKND